jgi:3-oxoacyl-[acyl-carrier protein] reductase
MMRIDNTVALVTGGSRGIGRAIALRLSAAGAQVVVNYRSSEEAARELCAEIRADGGRARAFCADVMQPEDVSRLAHDVANELGSVGVLVNNAGMARVQSAQDVTTLDWDEVIDANLKSAFLVTQAFLPPMLAARFGRIVNLSSTAAQIGGFVGPHYAASKAGIIGLTHYYASRLAGEGITVNAIAPALIDTAMVRDAGLVADHIPVGRFGTAEEVAEFVFAVASNGYITGQTVNINGGIYPT